ncbi:MAG TPA: tetratricopeptide repeat protein, partial [Planctomicrobium sp.]|nr:tetratricopeptide repeat protein [Planctomicrobium sp.]
MDWVRLVQFFSSPRFVVSALVVVTVLCYAGTFRNEFVDFDDDRYVTHNEVVQQGLTLEGIVYAFTTVHTGNWIPLTWLSLQLDVSLFGLNPAGFHGMNLFFHVVNVLLLYQLVRSIGGSLGQGFLVAALFAVHPLHVESVAWMSERKDVISTAFLLWACLAYVRYTRSPSPQRYVGVMLPLALGLMAKPMLVTLPVLLLLADFWPLNRCRELAGTNTDSTKTRFPFWKLCLEKVPLLLVVVAISAVTIFAQKTDLAMVNTDIHPIPARVANAVCSSVWYLSKTFWPVELCVFYPLDYGVIDWPNTIWSAIVLCAVTAGVLSQWRARPYLLFGWGWFLISLLPVIGLVQVGGQAHADRFSYVPHLGLFFAIVWWGTEVVDRLKLSSQVKWSLAGVPLLFCGILTVQQVAIWRDSVTLWTHADRVQTENWKARFHLGQHELRNRNWSAARALAEQSIQIRPGNTDAWGLVGKTYVQEQRWEEAQQAFEYALSMDHWHRDSLIGLAAVAYGKNRPRDAEQFLLLTLEKTPRDSFARTQLGLLYAETGRLEGALEQLLIVTQQAPRNPTAWKVTGQLLAKSDRFDEAIASLNQAIQRQP